MTRRLARKIGRIILITLIITAAGIEGVFPGVLTQYLPAWTQGIPAWVVLLVLVFGVSLAFEVHSRRTIRRWQTRPCEREDEDDN